MNERPNAKLIRLCCDGELTPQQAAALQQCVDSCPEHAQTVEQQVKAEQRLRECVGRVLETSCQCAPGELRRSIKLALAREASHSAKLGGAKPGWMRIFANPNHANVLAVAATLLLVAGAVLYGIFGRSIDQLSPQPPIDLVAGAALFASQEHGVSTMTISPEQEAEADLRQWLGAPVDVFDLSDVNYEFIGARHCKMPVPAQTGHLVYRKHQVKGNQPRPMVSIFVVPNEGGCKGRLCKDLTLGQWREINGTLKCPRRVVHATDGRLVYFLVCCDERDLETVTTHVQKMLLTSTASPVPPAIADR